MTIGFADGSQYESEFEMLIRRSTPSTGDMTDLGKEGLEARSAVPSDSASDELGIPLGGINKFQKWYGLPEQQPLSHPEMHPEDVENLEQIPGRRITDEQPDGVEASQQYAMSNKDELFRKPGVRGEGGGGGFSKPSNDNNANKGLGPNQRAWGAEGGTKVGYRIWDGLEQRYISNMYKSDLSQARRARSTAEKKNLEYGAHRYSAHPIFETPSD